MTGALTVKMDDKNFIIEFEPLGKRVLCEEGQTLLQCAHGAGIQILSVCGGMGLCGSCKVRVLKGPTSDLTSSEIEQFTLPEIQRGWRLACQLRPKGFLTVYVPLESLAHNYRLQIEGLEREVELNPNVKTFEIELSPPALEDPRADTDRIEEGLRNKGFKCKGFDVETLRDMPLKLRESSWKVKALLRDGELIGILPREKAVLGVAVDLGTTKIALYLVDLESGRTIQAVGLPNPQILYGEDIITRIQKAIKSEENAQMLQKSIIDSINEAIITLLKKLNFSTDQLVEGVFVGNTAMHHLFLGLPVRYLASAPFVPVISQALEVKARDLGLSFSKGAYLRFFPNIAGFVGGDHVAALLAIGAWTEKGPVLLLDIGTNTEISLIREGKIFTVSTPSGPAFEGGHIKHGMRAASGAIERIKLSENEVWIKTIDDIPPIGICGSGLIDVVAELFRIGVLDESGRFKGRHPRLRDSEGVKEFVLVEKKEMNNDQTITITQKDVRELQLAKASIRAGIQKLLNEMNLEEDALEKVYIAGAFGTYIDVGNAIYIGMLPALPRERFIQVGNAAGVGAKIALLSKNKQEEADLIAKTCHYIELAANKDFQRLLLEASFLGKYKITDERRRYVDGDQDQ
jgi:uncharacterized 2Fe-2S/4Fe-4S cluster protein (DUF4445 family)